MYKPFPVSLAFTLLAFLAISGCSDSSDYVTVEAPGEDIASEDQTPPRQLATSFTYHGEIAEIIEEKCVICHVEGDIAPFPLDSLEKVQDYASAVAFVVEAGTMPPWPPTNGYTPFRKNRSLSQQQRFMLLDWLDGGMPEGEPAVASQSTEEEGDPPESPDFNHRLRMPQAYTPTLQPDDHRCFAIPWPEDEFTYVTAVDVLPDQTEEVHHVIVSIAEPEDAPLYYAADGENGRPGWYCLGAGGVDGAPLPRQIGGWVPGGGREDTPAGTGIGVEPGSVLVVQMHYNTLVTDPTPDQSTVLVATSPEVERPARGFLLTNPAFLQEGGMPIPAGESHVEHEWTVPAFGLATVFGRDIGLKPFDSWVMHQGFLHMHNLGTSGRITLLREDGTEQVLLDIRDWDFNWQGTYNFEQEVLIQPQDQIKLECTWDNSQENQEFVNGQQLQTQYVEWGDGTQDEMCLMSVMMTRPLDTLDYQHRPTQHIESPTYMQVFRPGDLVPLRFLFNNFSLHEPGDHGMGHDHAGGSGDHSQVFEGHYHVYLNTDDDAADHLTAWNDTYYFELPDDIEAGEHTLRVSLRGPDHHALGIEERATIQVLSDEGVNSQALTDVNAWEPTPASDDPLNEHRPDEDDCPDNSWYNEDGAIEVETGYCRYLSISQPSLVALEAGQTLHVVLWHGDLVYDEPAEAHVAISIDGKIAWEKTVQVPTDAGIHDVRVPIDFTAPAGAQVNYHLHNHGYNTWTLLKLEVEQ